MAFSVGNPVNTALVLYIIYRVNSILFPSIKPPTAIPHDFRDGYSWMPKAHPPTMLYKTYTPKALLPFNGVNGQRILLAINGIVFDVSRGRNFYGPEGMYANFAGRDASRGMAKQSFDEEMLTDIDQPLDKLQDLTPSEIENMNGWIDHFSNSTPIFATPNWGDRLLLMSPASSQPPFERTHLRKDEQDGKEDLFATLFSPPTPPASPLPVPAYDATTAISSTKPQSSMHSRKFSTSSCEFGSFVSVPAADDPLFADERTAFSPISPTSGLEFFDQFTDHAAKSNAQKRQVLDELLLHEDNPLYWVNDTSEPAPPGLDTLETGVEQLSFSHSPVPPVHEEPDPSDFQEGGRPPGSPTLIDFNTSPEHTAPSPAVPVRNTNHSTPDPTVDAPALRNPMSGSLTSRWFSSLRPLDRKLSFTDPTSVTGFFEPPGPFHPPRQASVSSSVQSSPMKAPSRPLPELTHGTPFASQTYIPPTGAPGFEGDRAWNKSHFEFDPGSKVSRKSVILKGRKDITSIVLTPSLADLIRPYLPPIPRLSGSWALLYSLDQHGISLNTLYARCSTHLGGSLVVIKDSEDALFGAWIGESVHQSKGAYYGLGESFLWKFKKTLRVYKWTGMNDYVALCEPEYLSFGGGDGKYGLYLDATLLDGSSAWCPTFANEPLCSDSGHNQGDTITFECVGLEVWGVGR